MHIQLYNNMKAARHKQMFAELENEINALGSDEDESEEQEALPQKPVYSMKNKPYCLDPYEENDS